LGKYYFYFWSIEGICEKYDFENKKWNIFEDYFNVIKKNNLENTK